MYLIAFFVRRWLFYAYRWAVLPKTLLIMTKLTLLLTICCMQICAATRSQSVTLTVTNVPIETVFTEIKKQTGYSIIWNEKQMAKLPPVSLNVKNVSVEEALKQALLDKSLSFTFIGKMIAIRDARETSRDLNLDFNIAPSLLISGMIRDESGAPIEGASIVLKGSKKGASSDKEGRFKLEVSGRDSVVTIVVTSVGFQPRELKVKNGDNIDIVLLKAETKLDEVVVSTGLFDRKKDSYTGAVTTVTAKELAMFGNRNLLVSLRNIDPAFNIIENNQFGSNPNMIPDIQIRGNSSLPNVNEIKEETGGMNNPLVILDGFETTLQRLLDINQNEVESLTILKDASATAIYGSRGANGVIVIKSRLPQGSKGGKLQLSYRADITPEMPDLTSYNLMNGREKLELENLAGLYEWSRPEAAYDLKEYYNYLLGEINRGVETDWLSKPLRTGWGQRHNISLEGGDKVFRYSVSAQINDIQGAMKESFRRNINGNITLMYNHGKIRFRNHLMVNNMKSQESPYGSFSEYARMNPYWAAYDKEGNPLRFLGDPGRNIYGSRWFSLPGNPLYNATLNSFSKSTGNELINNFSLIWNPYQSLQVTFKLGISKSDDETDRFLPADHTSFQSMDILRRGSYDFGFGRGFKYDGGINLNFNKSFDKHSFYGGFDLSMLERKTYKYDFKLEGFNHPEFDFLAMALQYELGGKPSGSEALTRTIGLTTNLNYTYDGKYSIDLSGRTDGSSQFGSFNRFAPFWSVGLGWNLHNEKFFSQYDNIDRLRIRGSLGTTGTQKFSAYQALQTYRYSIGDRYYSYTGAQLMALGNENLRWQQKMNYNLGLDADFFGRRLTLTGELYKEVTNGMISSVNIPLSNGFNSYIDNIGKVENKGFELRATYFIVRNTKKNFSWSVTGSTVYNRNKIVEISQALKDAQKELESATGTVPSRLFKEGYATNTIWVVPSLGIDPSTGNEIYLDRNGKPTLTWSALDLTAAGIGEPKYRGTVSTMVRYRGFTMNLAFGYRFGGQLYNNTLIEKVETSNYQYNMDRRVYDSRWREPGDIAAFKGLLVTTPTYKTSRFVQNESTLQMQNINLQYDLSRSLVKKLGVQSSYVAMNMADAFYLSSVQRERGTSYPFSRLVTLTLGVVF